MIQIIISIDPSTQFLFEIIDKLRSSQINFNITELHPNSKSYEESFNLISKFDKNSVIIFLGHGTDDKLYGGEQLPDFEKKGIVKLNQMHVFENQNLFLLSCNSSLLIKKSYRLSKMNKAIGFGSLPTSKEEVESEKQFREQGITDQTIQDFKNEIVQTVSDSLIFYHQDFNKLLDQLKLLLDQRINYAVLVKQDRNLADLLFKMRNEIVIY